MAKKRTAAVAEPPPPLRLEWRSPAELAENPRNWRRHPDAQIAALGDVLGEVGWAGACLYNEATGRLIDGHARKKVAVEQGCEKVPVLVGSWDEAAEAKILATLDPLAAMATADSAALDALLRDVQTGSQAIGDMLTQLAEEAGIVPPGATSAAEDPGPQIDRAKELQVKWGTATGQLWVVPSLATPGKEHRLLCGDSTKGEDVGRVMGGDTPFLMVTDPPYGVEYEAGWRDGVVGEFGHGARIKGAVANDDRADWSAAWALFSGDVVYTWSPGGDHVLVTGQALVSSGFDIRAMIVWRKQHFAISRGAYHYQHEPCWYAVRKGCTAKWGGDRTQSTVWDIASLNPAGRTEERCQHPTQKPVECMARPMRNHGEPGDIVYDPFLGSGTTLVAAEQTGRLCRGIEISPAYVAVALERLAGMGLAPRQEGA